MNTRPDRARGILLLEQQRRRHHDVGVHETLDLAGQFHRSAPGKQAPRTVSAIYTGDSLALRPFFEQLAIAGGGDLSVHQGQMIESVLLSVLKGA